MRKLFGVILLASILLFTATVQAAELLIIHTNDFHGRILNTDDRGKSMGLAEMVAAIKKLRAENPNSLWLDAGDTFHGMPIINISDGKNMVTLLNEAGLNAMTPGNHDFNYGVPKLLELKQMAKFDILDANVTSKVDDKNLFPPYKIYTLKNNLKVGVFGLTTPDTAYKARPVLVGGLNFLDPVTAAKKIVKALRPKCDVLIAITHLGVEPTDKFKSTDVANAVEGIDLIVDGHSHTVLPSGLTINNTLIVQTGAHAYNIGKATIKLDGKKIIAKRSELISKDDAKKFAPNPDKKVVAAINKIEKDTQKLFSQVIGHSDKALVSERNLIRTSETELGALVTDAFRWRTGADFAIINAGGIRGQIPQGNITKGDIKSVFPFGNRLQVIEIDGKTIREMLEHSASIYPEPFAGFLQVSGISFSFDPRQKVGSRVSDIYINNKPIGDSDVYTMATADFLLEGGDGYDCLKVFQVIGQFGTLEEVLGDYINEVDIKNIAMGRIIRK